MRCPGKMAAHLSYGRVNLNVLREAVRRELREFLDKCAGSKEHEVEKMFTLKGSRLPAADVKNIIFLVRPRLELMDIIAENVLSEDRRGPTRDFHILFVPRRSLLCEQRLKDLGVLGSFIHREEYSLDLIPFDGDLLSMESEGAFKECYLEGDQTSLYHAAKGLMTLQALYGTIPQIFGKGECARQVANMMVRMKREFTGSQNSVFPVFDNLLLLDRNVDLLTPLASQLTYEGLIDEIYGIQNSYVKLPPEKFAPKKQGGSGGGKDLPTEAKKLQLNSAEELYAEIRDKNFNAVGSVLSKKAKIISAAFEERHNAKTVGEIKQFVSQLPHMQAARGSLANHTSIAELIKDVTTTFENALSAGFIQATDYVEIWQVYLDYLRRRVDFRQDSSKELEELRSMFTRALEYLQQEVEERFSESGDPSCLIMQSWARVEARLCNNMQKARELWDSIMTRGNAKYANMWLEYYNLERAHGDTQHCRKALHRAVQCTSDYPEHVCEVLLTMERTEGTLEDWDLAIQKTETRLARVNEQRMKAAEKEAALVQQEEEKAEQRKKVRAEKKALKKKKKTRGADKRREDEDEENEWGEEEEEQPSKRRRTENSLASGEASAMKEETELSGKCLTIDVGPPSKQKEKAASLKRDMPKVAHDSSKDSVTVFVSNLPYSIEEPEVKLRPLFEVCGEVVQIRPIFSNRGDFRGYCYVEFGEEKSAQQALELDRKIVEGRPMFVSPCVDKSKNPDFKVFRYSTTLEKHKLFISGLPFSCTKEELEDICKAHGTVKDLRLVTNRAGKPKGLAYVEYENESQASQAVMKMDGMTIRENVIKVAISNPPQRKVPEKPEVRTAPGAPMLPRQMYGARGKGRTQLSLLPRALQRQGAAPQAENGPAPGPAVAPSVATEAPKMSNADFAKLLLRK